MFQPSTKMMSRTQAFILKVKCQQQDITGTVMGLPVNTSSDEEEMEEAGSSPQMLQEDPPDKVETPSGADGKSQAEVSMPCPQSCGAGLEAEAEALRSPASLPPGSPGPLGC
ncbi:UNVERIFIED_CONTAM: hypothetical protein K2H54_034298 [Gekko kuhli]